ncbi:MAG: NAD+ synthase [Planctomycetota bacterium]
MRLALAQLNPTVGDIGGNVQAITRFAAAASQAEADLLVLPELALSGYPPRDLLHQQGFLDDVAAAAAELAASMPAGLVALVGAPVRAAAGERPTNALLVMRDGLIAARYDKRLLPSYDVFDEDRYFRAGAQPLVIDVAGVPVGVSVCEDLWKGVDVGPDVTSSERYQDAHDPVQALVDAGARIIVNASASPFVQGKGHRQREILTRHVQHHGVALASVNQVGGNDDLIFDGHCAVFVPGRDAPRCIAAGPGFTSSMEIVDLPDDPAQWSSMPAVVDPLLERDAMQHLFDALVLGVRDYVRKTGFTRALLGISGGIDSALTAVIASAALGRENVLGVAMPSRYSSDHSLEDAEALARLLGIEAITTPIAPAHAAMESMLGPAFDAIDATSEPGVTEENVQSRIRGVITMAISNKTGALLLTTGNKSELAVGYCTLYGDMNGGLAVLSDVSKEDVYRLSRWINEHHAAVGFAQPPIPERTITKPPSAELRPGQFDADSLPPYDVLDEIIERYVERQQHPAAIVAETGFDAALVARITRLIDVNEYKRKQMPIGLKVSSIAFGRGRRRPIAQGYRPDRSIGS